MKIVHLFIPMFILVTLACSSVMIAVPTNPAPFPTSTMISATPIPARIPESATPIPPTMAPAQIPATTVLKSSPTSQQPASNGTSVSYGIVSLILPSGLASGISGSQFPRVDTSDAAWWQKTPGHILINLDDYILQGKSNQPQIFVYPALGYAELVPAAFEGIHRLDNILGVPGAPISSEQLPPVPFFNSKQVFATNIQIITFQSGRGVRFLTEYGQAPASANNHDLFYEFQGLTTSGDYYIVAILPVNIPMLGESSDPGAAVPVGGVGFPDMGNPNADWNTYYNAVFVQLNAQAPTEFTPTLNQLDLMIQSMKITQ